MGIPQVIIALTILAGWTSVPDLLSSLIVAKKWKADMAVANAVGSNIFDILICLWLPWMVYILWTWESIVVPTTGLYESVLVILGIMVIMMFYMVAGKYKINKTYGIMLIGMYLAYLAYQVYLAYM
jgi:sodium/potassium/calcium exchanger 4